jgi:hypothetical protein
MRKFILAAAVFSIAIVDTHGQQLAGTGKYSGPGGFGGGYQAVTYCGNNPESWVRGSVFLDKQTGAITFKMELETDALHAGPKGQIIAYVYDCSGQLISKVGSPEVGRGGKGPDGKVADTRLESNSTLGPDIGHRACSIQVVANCTGTVDNWFNVDPGKLNDAGKLIEFLINLLPLVAG